MITITIKTDNEAFQNGNREAEIARVLRMLANRIENDDRPTLIFDRNGNEIGKVVDRR